MVRALVLAEQRNDWSRTGWGGFLFFPLPRALIAVVTFLVARRPINLFLLKPRVGTFLQCVILHWKSASPLRQCITRTHTHVRVSVLICASLAFVVASAGLP